MVTKKIKKIETPIDQRETFVSISKSFADSDLTVEEKLKTLYALQKADSQLDKILQLRGELPQEVESLENGIAQIKAKIAVVNDNIEAYTKGIAASKHDAQECDDNIAKYKKQLENIANSREFDSINKEIENQDILKQIAEKNAIEARAKIAELKSELEEIKESAAVQAEDLKAKKEELAHIVEITSDEEKKLTAAREECAAKIDERTMSAYERIRASVHNHLAVVPLYNNNSCGGCFSTIIPQRIVDVNSNRKLIICENCGRIIVSASLDE